MTQKDLKFFFVERFHELLNRNSMDSYRVKCNNVFTLFRELRDVIDNWLRGYVKQFDTVILCVDETVAAMKEDDIIDYSFYDKQLMIDDLTQFTKADQKSRGELGNQSIYLISKCIRTNQDIYLEKLYTAINSILESDNEVNSDTFYPLANRLDRLASALACELLNERFSMRHLYRESMKLKSNVADFYNAFDRFRQLHRHETSLNTYDVVLKMNGGNNNRLTTIQGFKTQLEEDLVPQDKRNDKINSFLNNRGTLYYSCHVSAHDSATAISLAIEKMESVVDRAMLGYSILDPQVQRSALVIITSLADKVYLVQPINVRDASYADDEQVVHNMLMKIDTILRNNNIANDVKDRLTSALRHLRIGNTEADTGQQLVNYWVALEFIFSSPKAIDSTMARIEKNLLNILMCCYANRRVSYLNDALHKNNTLAADKDWWTLGEAELSTLIVNQTSQLLRYHLQAMKAALLNTRDAARCFFGNHRDHLYWQLYRIYRYRNRLIHEAAILPGLENVIRCQRFYLVLLLNQLIGYFSRTQLKSLTMDSFFFEYTQKVNILNDIIKQEQDGTQRISKLMQIVVYNELIRQNV